MNFRFSISDLRLRYRSPRRGPIANRKSKIKKSSGFSLIEVLIAVLILAILVAAASRGLVTSIATDSVSQQLFDGNLVMNRIEAARQRSADFEQLQALAAPRWILTETRQQASQTNAIAWRILTLQSGQRPSLRILHHLRD